MKEKRQTDRILQYAYPMPPTRLLRVALAKSTIESEKPSFLSSNVFSNLLSNAFIAVSSPELIDSVVTGLGDDFELKRTSNYPASKTNS